MKLNTSSWSHSPRCNHKPAAGNPGFTLIELLIAVGLTVLIITSLAGLFNVQVKAWRQESLHSEAIQNHWAASRWLEKDLKWARHVTVSAGGTRVVLEKPDILVPVDEHGYLHPKWQEVTYSLVNGQLQRSVNNSNNPVAQGVVEFSCSLAANKRVATIHLVSEVQGRPVQTAFKVWLRNVRE